MKVALTEFLTLDGVCQGPGSPSEDTTDGFTRGGWLVPHMDPTFVRRASDWLDHADALLLGRRTYEAFARDWPQITDPSDPFAERMNTLPKYVVSNTLTHGTWDPTTVLGGEAVSAVSDLKKKPGEEVQVHGSAVLADSLLSAGLVDIVRLVIAPVLLRQGRRLVVHAAPAASLRLVHHETTPQGLLLLEYEATTTPTQGEYQGVAELL